MINLLGAKELKIEKKIIIIILGLCLIYNVALIFSFEKIYPENLKVENMIAEVISLKEETDYYCKYEIKVKNFSLKSSKNTKNILYTKNEKLFPGDIVVISGNFEKASKATNYKQFDYRNYLKQNKIYGIIYEEKIKVIKTQKDIYYFLGKVRNELLKRIESNYNHEVSGFLEGILIGFNNNLSKEVLEDFRNSSISHVLAISGMHVYIVIDFYSFFLEIFIKNKKIRNYILMIFLIFFYLITGMSNSCLRAIIMIVLKLLAFNLNRRYNFFSSLIFSFFIIIAINIYNIFNIAVWLSFMGVLGIYIFLESFDKILRHFDKTILRIIIPYILPQILILPIVIYSFNFISISFAISNFIIAITIDKILILGYFSILLNSKFLSYINSFFISIIFKISQICSKGNIYLKTPNISYIFAYYIFLFFLILYIRKYKFKFWKNILNKVKRKKLYIVAAIILICSILMQFIYNEIYVNSTLKIYFVDVGQGDCTVIKTPKGRNIVIDGGEENNMFFPYLLDRGINKIDYLIISHFDNDHVGEILRIIRKIDVKQIIIGRQFEMSENYTEFLKLVKKNKIEVKTVEAGEELHIEKDVKLNILWPNSQNVINENSLNNNSLVFKLMYNNFSMLFTGDIEKIAEESIFKRYKNTNLLKSTILKVAHHGSNTSSIVEFLEMVNPKISLIGVGKNNNFGHPSQITLNNLKNFDSQIYRTDLDGEINISIDYEGKIEVKKYINE